MSRTKNSARNTFFGTINTTISMLCPFIIRTIIIKVLGTEYLGLDGLFTSILQFLSLSELGFGAAMVYTMYKPMAENDTKTICALLKFYKKIYATVGGVILLLGLGCIPFLPVLIHGNVPSSMNIYVLYSITLLGTVISYFLFAYKSALLTAAQRVDVESRLTIVFNLLRYISQIAVLLLFKSYYIYLICGPIATICINFARSRKVDKMFPQYVCEGLLDPLEKKHLFKQVGSLFGYKLSGTIILSADNMVISAFQGLSAVAIYNNYYYVIAALRSFIRVFIDSIRPSVGNSIVKESPEKNYRDLHRVTFLVAWVVGWCFICLNCLFQHFMTLWVGEQYLFSFSTVVLLSSYFYCWMITDVIVMYQDALGMWYDARFVPYISAGANVVSNIILIQIIGINGVIISSALAIVLISFPVILRIVFKNYFNRSFWPYLGKILFYTIVISILGIAFYQLCSLLPTAGYLWFIVKLLIVGIFPHLCLLLIYCKTEEEKWMLALMKNMLTKIKNR